MVRKTTENWICLSGIIAAIFYFLHVIFGTLNYPGYSNISQAVSDLTALDSPSYIISTKYVTVYGAFSSLCCTILFLMIKKSSYKIFNIGILLYGIMNWISFIGYTLFPLSGKGFQGTIEDIFHFYIITISVIILSIFSLILIFIGGIKKNTIKWISISSIITFLFVFIGAIGTGLGPKEYFGIFERFTAFSIVVFTGLLGYFGFLYNEE